jgi:hypothetical protein
VSSSSSMGEHVAGSRKASRSLRPSGFTPAFGRAEALRAAAYGTTEVVPLTRRWYMARRPWAKARATSRALKETTVYGTEILAKAQG